MARPGSAPMPWSFRLPVRRATPCVSDEECESPAAVLRTARACSRLHHPSRFTCTGYLSTRVPGMPAEPHSFWLEARARAGRRRGRKDNAVAGVITSVHASVPRYRPVRRWTGTVASSCAERTVTKSQIRILSTIYFANSAAKIYPEFTRILYIS